MLHGNCSEQEITILLEDKDIFNTTKAMQASQMIFKAYLQQKQIPEPATLEDLEQFYKNSTLK